MLKTLIGTLIAVCITASPAFSADVMDKISINEAMQLEKVKALFPGDIAFYWGDQQHPPVHKRYGNYKSSKRTNALGKSRLNACAWAMASALDALQKRAHTEGGNAVINIVSNIKDHPESSQSEFNCLVGSLMVNVALKGDVVKISK